MNLLSHSTHTLAAVRPFARAIMAAILVSLAPAALAAEAVHSAPSLPVSGAFNQLATAIFALAILHTFAAPRIMRWAHKLEHKHQQRLQTDPAPAHAAASTRSPNEVSFLAEVVHFLGEIEVVFGLWVVPLVIVMIAFFGWHPTVSYLNNLNFTEPLFVLVIMSIAATRPVMVLAQATLAGVAKIGRGSVGAWWLSILTLGPLLGSFITEPAAMTISALLLAQQFYTLQPSRKLAYATIGLLFVNVSIGGTLTHFAAPPVLMVAAKWGWDTPFMLTHFGWKAVVSILLSNILYWLFFRKEFSALNSAAAPGTARNQGPRVPRRIIIIHLLFLAWTVLTNHYPVLFIGGFLFFLGFTQATAHHQDDLSLRTPLLVAFFLAGLVIHGGLQGWWIDPLLRRLDQTPLFFGSTLLTAFNDNAAITYLASLVPSLTEPLKYAVVAGAVVGGGLTVIANAPNPAGVTLLSRFFDGSVVPSGLLAGALPATIIAALVFLLL